jgi:hypothetical protein
VEILENYQALFNSPIRYGPSENRTFELSETTPEQKEKWFVRTNGGFFRIKKPWKFDINIFYFHSNKRKFPSSLHISCSPRYFEKQSWVEEYLKLHNDLYLWGEMDHGSISLWNEFLDKNVYPGGGAGGPNISVSLPGIYWINYFGPNYVDRLGKRKFESLNCYKKYRLNDGGFFIQSRESIFDYTGKGNSIEDNRIINHLGREEFFIKEP